MRIFHFLKKNHEFAERHLDRKLIVRLSLFILVFLGLLGFIMYDIVENDFNPFLIIGGFVPGVGMGALAGRMFYIHWHEETSKVVARLDKIGVIILVLYIAFSIARKWIFSLWLHGPVLTGFTFSFATGAILGRILTMSSNIRKVLTSRGIETEGKI